MNKKDIQELLMFTYKRTIDDNKKDFMIIFGIIGKLCSYLMAKGILNESDIKDIIKIEVGENNE